MERLTPEQVKRLMQPLDPTQIHECADGLHRVSHAYVRQTLIDIFGFGGYDTTTLELFNMRQFKIKDDGTDKPFFASYRAQVRLTVKTPTGDRLGTWDGAATGAALAHTETHAHDQALKFALSRALVHAAVNLGEQFGLSLYTQDPLTLPEPPGSQP